MIYICLSMLLLCMVVFPYCFFRRPPKPKPHHTYAYILVLGCPALADGSLSTAQKKRINAAIQYYQMGFSDTIILSGAAVKNNVIEADAMAHYLKQALPQAHICTETKAKNTYQNMQFSKQAFPTETILVVSGSSHLRRAYFFARKFYSQATLGYGEFHDPWYYYLWEYTRMWIAIYWEIKLYRKKNRT